MRRLLFIFVIAASFQLGNVKADAKDPAQFDQNGFANHVTATVFSKRLKAVDAILTSETGRVYALDTVRGHIIELQDRGLDGRADTQRTLPHRFNKPTAMVLQDGQLYVADQDAIWKVGPDNKTQIASLTRSRATGKIHLVSGDDSRKLIVGLTRAGAAFLINLDLTTGVADVRAETPGELKAMKRLPNGTLWTSVSSAKNTSHFLLEAQATGQVVKTVISDFTVAPQKTPWAGELIAILNGRQLARIPMKFGQPSLTDQITLQSAQRTPRPSDPEPFVALAADQRGIFIYDRQSKMLWVVTPNAPSPQSNSKASQASPNDKKPDP